jgi:hypothetical protein
MRVLICGSRDWQDHARIRADLAAVQASRGPIALVITGGARGADLAGHTAARTLGIPTTEYRADWDRHRTAAGPIRNQRMLDEGRPVLVLAYRTHPDSRGTNDMIRRARVAGVETIVVDA